MGDLIILFSCALFSFPIKRSWILYRSKDRKISKTLNIRTRGSQNVLLENNFMTNCVLSQVAFVSLWGHFVIDFFARLLLIMHRKFLYTEKTWRHHRVIFLLTDKTFLLTSSQNNNSIHTAPFLCLNNRIIFVYRQ